MIQKSQDFLLNESSDRLLRKKEAAARLASSERTIDRMANSGSLTRIKIRGAVRFRESEIKSIIKGESYD